METVKALCAQCRKATNHILLQKHDTSGSTADGDIQWWDSHQIVQCAGCDEISFRCTSMCTENYDPYSGDLTKNETLYPERTQGRTPMAGYVDFPHKTKRVYMETLKALSSGMPLLAAIGLRALIESICLEQKTKSKTLAKGIDELAANGLLSQKQAEFLHNHRFMGNVAAHEIEAPKPEHLIAALEIAETLLKTIYILPEIAEQIKPKTKKK